MSVRDSESTSGLGLPESESSQVQAALTAHAHSSLAWRKEQTRDELEKIKRRVQHTVQAFELANNRPSLESLQQANMQFVEDMAHLEVIVWDQVNKKKYQQQMTVFIVGYQQLCGERKHILSQLNEFFIQNAKLGEEDSISTSEDMDIELDDVAMQVKDALSAAERATIRLAEISQEIISYMSSTAISNTQKSVLCLSPLCRSRSRLDKAVNQAREDILQLTGKLLQTQADLENKDERLKELLKQNEAKFLESQYFRSQLETTKTTLSSVQQELGLQISMREAEVRRQAARITELERELQERGVNQGSVQEIQPPASQDSECVQPGTSASEAAAMEEPRGQRGEGDPGSRVDIEDLKENSQLRITELQRGNMVSTYCMSGVGFIGLP
ncbi:COP1-interactive protein 1-like [Acipenser oxyrinchus oxyrinchus]|uniref:COP1-interactive protein 1-like n=1 Tax=Acipenser oxyrinchus oxyrinchus TaxID=40147 RepID=A0AAD8CZK4_ACIOX|nr:COP1-interactive protein 1-like [Acipenser oxyrinchus oxyrinchus]